MSSGSHSGLPERIAFELFESLAKAAKVAKVATAAQG